MTSIGEEGHQLLELSDLPDEILIRILTLLPTTEDAVRTCLLLLRRNERQHLWKFLTRLKFRHHDDGFLKRGSHFMNFVERVMDLRDHSVPLVSFSLQCLIKEENDADRIETWITKAVQCNVEEITLFIYDCGHEMRLLPSCIFGCQSLVKLDLQFITFDVPSSSVVCLPRLRYLRLDQVILVDDESIEMLLSSPLLEFFIINQCSWRRIEYIHVSCPKLQVLEILDGSLFGSYHSAKICIIGDNLKHFFYMGKLKNKFRICSSSTQLTTVGIYAYEEMFGDLGQNCYDILKGIIWTRNLALSDYFLEGFQNISELRNTVQVFECLTRLDIRVCRKEMPIDSFVLVKFFERCPHLEYLNIGKLSNTNGNPQLSPLPLCFQTSLKKILVHYYVLGDDTADVAINVLLNSALVLEDLVIYCLVDEENGFFEGCPEIQDLQDRLNRHPRVSKDCVISVRFKYYYIKSSSWFSYYNECYVESRTES